MEEDARDRDPALGEEVHRLIEGFDSSLEQDQVLWVCTECPREVVYTPGAGFQVRVPGNFTYFHVLPEGFHWSGEQVLDFSEDL